MLFETPIATDKASPFVSVVVPVYEPDEGLVVLARCLSVQTYPLDRFEVLFVDDGSTRADSGAVFNAALDVLPANLSVRCIRQENQGSYAARNSGIAAARGDFLLFTDADCQPRPDWVSALVTALRAGDAPLVAGAIAMTRSDEACVSEWYDSLLGLPQQWFAQSVGFGATANLGVTRACMNALQGFDATLRSGGDQEFCDRARHKGFQLAYCPSAEIVHPARVSLKELARKTSRVAQGRADAYASPRYLLPQGFGALVKQRNPGLMTAIPPQMHWKLRVLHARLEWIRILSYGRRIMQKRIKQST